MNTALKWGNKWSPITAAVHFPRCISFLGAMQVHRDSREDVPIATAVQAPNAASWQCNSGAGRLIISLFSSFVAKNRQHVHEYGIAGIGVSGCKRSTYFSS